MRSSCRAACRACFNFLRERQGAGQAGKTQQGKRNTRMTHGSSLPACIRTWGWRDAIGALECEGRGALDGLYTGGVERRVDL